MRGRVSQDRRMFTRVETRLECEITCAEAVHPALILDLSIKGANLACQHLPRPGSKVTIHLSSPSLKKDLTIESTVAEGKRGFGRRVGLSDWQRFGVSFDRIVCEIVPLLQAPVTLPYYRYPGRAAR